MYRFYNAPQLISLPFSAAMDVYNQWSSQIIEDNCGVQLKVYVQLNGFEKPWSMVQKWIPCLKMDCFLKMNTMLLMIIGRIPKSL